MDRHMVFNDLEKEHDRVPRIHPSVDVEKEKTISNI